MKKPAARVNNAINNAKQQPRVKKVGGVTGRGFMPGKSGNPKGRPPVRGLLNALRSAVAEPASDGATVEQELVRVLILEALKGRNRLAAIQTIFDRLEGKPKQQLDLNDITRSMANRSSKELEHFAIHGVWPDQQNESRDDEHVTH